MKLSWQMLTSYTFHFALLGLFAVGLYYGDLYAAFASLFSFGLMSIPLFLRRRGLVAIPWELNLWIFIALFLHNLGVLADYYDRFWWWDKLTHFLSASLIAGFGFIFIVIIDKYVDTIYLPQRMLSFFIIVFVLAMGVVWEIFEFGFDVFLGTRMQYSLDDTVMDLVFDLLGGLVVAVLGPVYLRYRSVESLVEEFRVGNTMETLRRNS